MSGPDVGFVGLGDLGAPMVATLIRAGFAVVAHDVRPEAVAAAEAVGATAATDAADLARAPVLAICVTGEADVDDLFAGDLGAGLVAGQLVLLHTTVHPDRLRALHAELAQRGVALVEAPVSGGRQGAVAGTLTIMAGGDDPDVARAMPVLEAVGATIRHVGPAGTGQLVKTLNNLLMHANHTLLLEALRLASGLGVAEQDLLDVVRSSTGSSWLVQTWPYIDDVLFDHTLAGTDALYDVMSAELRTALALAAALSVDLPVTALIADRYRLEMRSRQRTLVARGTHHHEGT